MKHILCCLLALSVTYTTSFAGDKGCFLFQGKNAKRTSTNCTPSIHNQVASL